MNDMWSTSYNSFLWWTCSQIKYSDMWINNCTKCCDRGKPRVLWGPEGHHPNQIVTSGKAGGCCWVGFWRVGIQKQQQRGRAFLEKIEETHKQGVLKRCKQERSQAAIHLCTNLNILTLSWNPWVIADLLAASGDRTYRHTSNLNLHPCQQYSYRYFSCPPLFYIFNHLPKWENHFGKHKWY